MNKNRVINSVEGSREIKETKSSNSLLSHGFESTLLSVHNIVVNRKKRGFSGMVGSVSRLKRVE